MNSFNESKYVIEEKFIADKLMLLHQIFLCLMMFRSEYWCVDDVLLVVNHDVSSSSCPCVLMHIVYMHCPTYLHKTTDVEWLFIRILVLNDWFCQHECIWHSNVATFIYDLRDWMRGGGGGRGGCPEFGIR